MDGNIIRFPKKTLKENKSLQNLNDPMKKTQLIDQKNIDKNNKKIWNKPSDILKELENKLKNVKFNESIDNFVNLKAFLTQV